MKHFKNTSRNVLHPCGPGFSTQQLRKEVCVTMRETSVVFVVFFFYVLLIPHSHADKYTINGCSSDGYIDVREDIGTTITCDGIQGRGYNIYWALSGNRIGDCGAPGSFDYCWLTDTNNTDYNLTRSSAFRSELRILGNFRSKAGETITCSQRDNSTKEACMINIIYPGLPTLPSLNRDTATRTVNGSYRVDKMYSSRNNYSCIWVMENETRHEIKRERIDPKLSKFNEPGNEFYNGTCFFSWPLPTEEGIYTINLTLVPGEKDKSYSAGTFVIDKYTINGCSSDGYIDVREDTGTTITCDGIQGWGYNIYWALSGNRIGDCNVPTSSQRCSLTDNTDYNLTRPTASRSELRILGNFRSKAGKTITCSQRNNDTQVSCMIDIVYPGRPTHPTLSTDGVTWTVSGSVRVEKIYSSRNHYSCIWTQENKTQHEIQTERVAPQLVNKSNQEFYNGTCSFSWPLPTEEGNYTSYLTVVPGDGDKPYSAGTFIIEHPGDPDIYCDVRPVVEKSDVTCQCRPSSTNAGIPAPSLSWPGFSNNSQLRLTNIKREDNGTQYACQLTWGPNARIVRTANYKLYLVPTLQEAGSEAQMFPAPAIGVAVGAVIAVIIVLVIVFIVIVRRKRQFEEHINIVYGLGEDLEEHTQQPESVPQPVAEALRTPSRNVTARKKTHENTATDKDVTESEADDGYYSKADDLPSPKGTECGDQYQNTQEVFANNQTSDAAVNKESGDTQDKQGAMYANVGIKDLKAGNAYTLQEDVNSVVDKTKKTSKQRNDVSSSNSTDQTNDQGPRGSVHAYILISSEPRDTDVISTLEGRDTKMHQDMTADKLAVTADPTAKAKPGQQQQTAVSQEDSPICRTSEDSGQTKSRQENMYANGQISSGAASKGSDYVENKQEAMYANVGSKVAEVGNFGTLQGTFSADLDKPKKTPKQLSGVFSSDSTDQSNDQSHRAPIQQDTTTEKSTANAKPAAKAKPNAQPSLYQQNTSSAQSEGAGERVRTFDTRAAGQNYENVGATSARTLVQIQSAFQKDRTETTTDDEYNTLNLLNPHGACRQEPDPDYSHLSYM